MKIDSCGNGEAKLKVFWKEFEKTFFSKKVFSKKVYFRIKGFLARGGERISATIILLFMFFVSS